MLYKNIPSDIKYISYLNNIKKVILIFIIALIIVNCYFFVCLIILELLISCQILFVTITILIIVDLRIILSPRSCVNALKNFLFFSFLQDVNESTKIQNDLTMKVWKLLNL